MSFDRPDDPDVPPSHWVERFAGLVPAGGRVLDVAAGHGRHVRCFRQRGHPVVAVDIDVSALAPWRGDVDVEIVAADLEGERPWPLPGQTFEGIVVTNYLHRPLLPVLAAAVAPGGVLIYETFGQGNEKLGRPRNPAFLLAPGELLQVFGRELQVVAYEHGSETVPRPAVRQRIAAVNAAGPVDLP